MRGYTGCGDAPEDVGGHSVGALVGNLTLDGAGVCRTVGLVVGTLTLDGAGVWRTVGFVVGTLTLKGAGVLRTVGFVVGGLTGAAVRPRTKFRQPG